MEEGKTRAYHSNGLDFETFSGNFLEYPFHTGFVGKGKKKGRESPARLRPFIPLAVLAGYGYGAPVYLEEGSARVGPRALSALIALVGALVESVLRIGYGPQDVISVR